jgi:predicted SAM-dependent methyltransferase
LKFLNLGCGEIFHKDWLNIDYVSNSPHVSQHDLSQGIPCNSETIDFVYHSHILEYFTKTDGEKFIQECNRVLKKGGGIRIVIPDLKTIVEEYLKCYATAKEKEDKLGEANYEWSMIELIDQLVREESGGEMLKYWGRETLINEETLEKRIGSVYKKYRNFNPNQTKPILTLKEKIIKFFLKRIDIEWEDYVKMKFYKIGERHKWMYDDFSLSLLLQKNGFEKIKIQTGDTSYMSGWNKYSNLDTNEDNSLRKPDSIIIEAIKR